MSRYRIRVQDHEEGRSTGLLMLAAGALAGLAAGIYLSERLGGVSGVSARLRARFGGTRHAEGDEEQSDVHAASGGHAGVAYEDEELEEETDEQFVSANEELEERVLEAFTNDPVLKERAIDIGAVSARTIELTGHVMSGSESDHAMVIARGVPGVDTVVNRLSVREDEQDEVETDDDDDLRYTESQWEGHTVGLPEVGDRPVSRYRSEQGAEPPELGGA